MTKLPPIQAIYTDGACSGNPGPGGWGTVLYFEGGQVHELGGGERETTNNRMEMQAAIAALEFLTQQTYSAPIELHTDSEYLKKGITQWIAGWKRKGWKNATGKPVLNQDLWMRLDSLSQTLKQNQKIDISWKYVRGHSGNAGNERCDEIARAFSHKRTIQLKKIDLDAAEKKQSLIIDKTSFNSTLTIATNVENPQPIPAASALKFYDGENALEEAEGELIMSDPGVADDSEASRVERLRYMIETLQVAEEVAKQGYLITSSELADLMDVNASAVTSRGDYWAWRNWTVSRIRREGNQILWQLERIDE
jgi:ribonuclease HI